MLRIESLEKTYGSHRVLRGVDLAIAPGEIVSLLGPNGAGKTTLVSIVAGLRRADAGSVTVGSVDGLRRPDLARHQIGFAPQDLGIYPTLTAHRNLALFGELAGLSRRRLHRQIRWVADALDLTDLLDRRAGVLSGGQKRRLHTAMAIVSRPPLLFLDEPTVGADIESRQRILDLVSELAADGCAVCYTTHYLPEIEQLDATVAVLEEGRILANDSVSNLVTQHGTSGMRLVFRGDAPRIDGFESTASEAFRSSPEPEMEVARILASANDWISRLESVEVVKPNLESAYSALTGRDGTARSHGLTHVA
ncbi:MAG: ABC transporter ATP-binding protein [Actinomycetota bacterium]|nr:ABC transporter ATP-binding protein [Actinomycetota bacterium]